ncbi:MULTISPECIES: DUF3949 domain-containing protein [Bacillus cereus group]|uniref:DUF3949 domain-containing protein n=1 Tax=Bacillus cereus TaxID=1396 RepID=A0A2B8SIL1_BACCE|nr:DUF3949 domain-containing protein [Bacillus cereus]PDY80592.1 hypothetical protein CON06_21700 [Bacillus cereus]PFA11555.1 hypothetical protein CN382_18950 [Bacillus cereus]PFM32448.1 hypothetical protein COJ43_27540 [Bacillus cereus]PGL57197.1 hypothetical protein CN927_25535 [Bacillus cereus]PGQ10654.1 hypothetical protein COA08_10930 [Bacillus cereus]
MSSELFFFVGIALFYFLVMIPIQYLYLQGLNEKKKRTGLSQQELYKQMSFEEEQLHFHVQGNPFNIPSAFVAYMILKVRGRKKASQY